MIDAILTTAASGLRVHAGDAARAADNLVQATTRPDTLEAGVVESIVDLTRAKIGFSASAATLRAGDEMSGRLLDIFV
ncbi:MAG: hypothetical protein RIC16_10385 [Rhodospirillales bacterium]